jgi:hypothetical protein
MQPLSTMPKIPHTTELPGATPDLLTRTAAKLEAIEPRAIAIITMLSRAQFYRP